MNSNNNILSNSEIESIIENVTNIIKNKITKQVTIKNERLFLIVDKPLTRVLPELHEDNDDFILNNKIIPSNNYNIKRKLQQKNQNKSNILNEKFGLSNLN